MTAPATVLIIEDEPHTRTLLRVTLAQQGMHTLFASTGREGIVAAAELAPDVVLLDLGLPDLDGVNVTSRIRECSSVPIVVISARGAEGDKIAALDSGANDYVTKPFSEGELLARIRVALRYRGQNGVDPPSTGVRTIGELVVDFDARVVTVGGRRISLTPTEYRLLSVMAQVPGRVVTHQQILARVWGPNHADDLNYLRVYMKKLRHKIEREPARPRYILSDPGVGYRLHVPASE